MKKALGYTKKNALEILGLLIAVVTGGVIPIFVGNDEKKDITMPVRGIELQRLSVSDLASGLSDKAEPLKFSLSFDGEPIQTIVSVLDVLRNESTTPILPVDFHEPLSVSVDDPWRILSVENEEQKNSSALDLEWKRVSDTEFAAVPFLFNPHDSISTTIYLTTEDPNYKALLKRDKDFESPKLTVWSSRVTGVSKIEDYKKPESEFAVTLNKLRKIQHFGNQWPPILVTLGGNGLIFFLGATVGFCMLFLRLLRKAGLVVDFSIRSTAYLMASFMLCLCSAEALSDILFENPFDILFRISGYQQNGSLGGNSNVLNWVVLGIFIVSLLGIVWKSYQTNRLRSV